LRRAIVRCSVAGVASIPKAAELVHLSVSERLELMDQIWTSLMPESDVAPLPEWHMDEIRRRVAAFAADGNPGRRADEVIAELKQRLP
jgi:putative addiction module component (TIGR02574 family)